MNEIRRLAEGIAASLAYDYCCFRGHLFGEGYLANSVGAILQSLHGGKSAQVVGGFQHPELSRRMIGGGRRPELDFVVARYDDSSDLRRARSAASPVRRSRDSMLLVTAVETKWAGSSHCTVPNIVWDLLRLEMLVLDNPLITATLVVAGPTSAMQTLRDQGLGTLLRFNDGPCSLDLVPISPDRRTLMAKLFKEQSLQTFNFPRKLELVASTPKLAVEDSFGFSVVAWRIKSTQNRATFTPANVPEYRINTGLGATDS